MMCAREFYEKSAREAIQLFDTIAENARTWETNTSIDLKCIAHQRGAESITKERMMSCKKNCQFNKEVGGHRDEKGERRN